MSRVRTAASLVWLAGASAAGMFALAGLRDPTHVLLLEARDLAFTTYTRDTAELNLPPGPLAARGFLVDSPASIASFAARLRADGLGPEIDSLRAIPGTTERMKALMRTAFAKGKDTGCGSVNDLHRKTLWVRTGGGCCSDYTEVFAALAGVVGVSAREANFGDSHTTGSFYAPEVGRWLFVDPYLGAMVRDSAGGYLSTRQYQSLVKAGGHPKYDFTGAEDDQRVAGVEAILKSGMYRLTYGSNVVAADKQYRRVARLPKPVAQLIGFAIGVRPQYRSFIPEASRGRALLLNMRRVVVLFGGYAAALFLLAYPVWLLFAAVRATRQRPGYTSNAALTENALRYEA